MMLEGSIRMVTVNLALCSLPFYVKNNTTEKQLESSSLVTAATQSFWVYFIYHLKQNPEANYRLPGFYTASCVSWELPP